LRSALVPEAKRTGKREMRGAQTKTAILDAAEELFASRGFHGVPIREIARASGGVPLALVSYHFDSKEGLFAAIFDRRMDAINQERCHMLDAALATARIAKTPPQLEAVMSALIVPIVKLSRDPGRGGVHFARLVAQVLSEPEEPRVYDIVAKHFDSIAERVQAALELALPGSNPTAVYWGYHLAVGSFLYAMANTGRLERLSKGRSSTTDPDAIIEHSVRYASAGLRSLASEPNDALARRRARTPLKCLPTPSDFHRRTARHCCRMARWYSISLVRKTLFTRKRWRERRK